MKKNFTMVLLLLLAALLGAGGMAFAREGKASLEVFYRNIQLVVNGVKVPVAAENEPFIHAGRTYVPLRLASEALGYDVAWNAATSTVTINAPGGVAGGDAAGCWDYQPAVMKPKAGWEAVDLTGLTRGQLLEALGCPPHVIRMTSVVSPEFNKELWVYHPYDEDPTGLFIWLKGNVFHHSMLNEFNGFGCYELTNPDFWE